jgi:hypothetical protein
MAAAPQLSVFLVLLENTENTKFSKLLPLKYSYWRRNVFFLNWLEEPGH